jgi:hypothetical protein
MITDEQSPFSGVTEQPRPYPTEVGDRNQSLR